MSYYVIRKPIIRAFDSVGQSGEGLSNDVTVRSLNLVQNTPWAINQYMLDVVSDLMNSGMSINDVPVLVPQKPDKPPWQPGMERSLNRERLDAYEELLSRHYEERTIINTALTMRDQERFWFPHNLDFRTRLYPIPAPFNPQGSDLSKGLLMFAEGRPLGDEGLRWLAIAIANAAGKDKESLEDRALWTWTHYEDIKEQVEQPMGGEWLQLDDPFQFLALAHEFIVATQGDAPTYHTHVPIHLDGSCNGLQHLSLMGLDPVGAAATNCASDVDRKDLYQEVGDVVLELVAKEAEAGDEMAAKVIHKLTDPKDRRKLVKRSVMTTPYGVTSFGIREFMITDGHVKDLDRDIRGPAANYLRDKIEESIATEISAAKRIQRFFAEVAKYCAENNTPLRWRTPAGSVVRQSYQHMAEHRVRTMGARYKILKPMGERHMDVAKMVNGAPPNVVHSADASHLQLSVCAMADTGITDFAMVHDSFGTHACNVDTMRMILRDELAGMYQDNYLVTFMDSVEELTSLRIPVRIPDRGTFDVNEVRTAEYVFS